MELFHKLMDQLQPYASFYRVLTMLICEQVYDSSYSTNEHELPVQELKSVLIVFAVYLARLFTVFIFIIYENQCTKVYKTKFPFVS